MRFSVRPAAGLAVLGTAILGLNIFALGGATAAEQSRDFQTFESVQSSEYAQAEGIEDSQQLEEETSSLANQTEQTSSDELDSQELGDQQELSDQVEPQAAGQPTNLDSGRYQIPFLFRSPPLSYNYGSYGYFWEGTNWDWLAAGLVGYDPYMVSTNYAHWKERGVIVNGGEAGALEIGKEHAWIVEVPAANVAGKWKLVDPKAPAYLQGKCVTLRYSVAPSVNDNNHVYGDGAHWAECSTGPDPRQDLTIIQSNPKDRPYVVGYGYTPGQMNYFFTQSVHWQFQPGIARDYFVGHPPQKYQTAPTVAFGVRKNELNGSPPEDTAYLAYGPGQWPGDGGEEKEPEPNETAFGLKLERRHVPQGESDFNNAGATFCASTLSGCEQTYEGVKAGEKIHFEYKITNISSDDAKPGWGTLTQVKMESSMLWNLTGNQPDLVCKLTDLSQQKNVSIGENKSLTCQGSYTVTAADVAQINQNGSKALSFGVKATGVPIGTNTLISSPIGDASAFEMGVRLLKGKDQADLKLTKTPAEGYDVVRRTLAEGGTPINWDLTVEHGGGVDVAADAYMATDWLPEGVKFLGFEDEDGDYHPANDLPKNSAYNSDEHVFTYLFDQPLVEKQTRTIQILGSLDKLESMDECEARESTIQNTARLTLTDVVDTDPSNNEAVANTKAVCDYFDVTKVIESRGADGGDFTIAVFGPKNRLTSADTGSKDTVTTPATVPEALPIANSSMIFGEVPQEGSNTDLTDYVATAACSIGDVPLDVTSFASASEKNSALSGLPSEAKGAFDSSDQTNLWKVEYHKNDLGNSPADIQCTITNTYAPKLASLSWGKVDQTGGLLAGSEWTLTDEDGPELKVSDCVADSADECDGADKDPARGRFLVEGLTAGAEYTLTETVAPPGFTLLEESSLVTTTAGKETWVGPDSEPAILEPAAIKDDLDHFVNYPQSLPALPLTGVDAQLGTWLVGGLLVAALLGVAIRTQRPSREGAHASN